MLGGFVRLVHFSMLTYGSMLSWAFVTAHNPFSMRVLTASSTGA
jgi:hypothetical protein